MNKKIDIRLTVGIYILTVIITILNISLVVQSLIKYKSLFSDDLNDYSKYILTLSITYVIGIIILECINIINCKSKNFIKYVTIIQLIYIILIDIYVTTISIIYHAEIINQPIYFYVGTINVLLPIVTLILSFIIIGLYKIFKYLIKQYNIRKQRYIYIDC